MHKKYNDVDVTETMTRNNYFLNWNFEGCIVVQNWTWNWKILLKRQGNLVIVLLNRYLISYKNKNSISKFATSLFYKIPQRSD